MENDASSYRRYLSGDEQAFEYIVKKYRDSLTCFINNFVRDYHIAEDIAIDVFAYLAAERRYNFKVSLKTYMFMLGRSRAIDYIRRRNKHPTVQLADAEPYLSSGASLEEEYLADQRKILLHRAIADLPEKMATVVYLVYFENLNYEETATVMKMNKKQIDNLLQRAKEELRSILVEKGI